MKSTNLVAMFLVSTRLFAEAPTPKDEKISQDLLNSNDAVSDIILIHADNDDDGSRLKRAAHALKGSVAYLSAGASVDAALQLELIGEEGNLAEAATCLQTLEAEIDRLTRAIQSSLPELVQ